MEAKAGAEQRAGQDTEDIGTVCEALEEARQEIQELKAGVKSLKEQVCSEKTQTKQRQTVGVAGEL